MMPPPPGLYSGTSTLALVARAKAKSQKKAEAKGHH